MKKKKTYREPELLITNFITSATLMNTGWGSATDNDLPFNEDDWLDD